MTPLDPAFPSLDRLSVAALTPYSSFGAPGLGLCFLPCPALSFSFLSYKVPESLQSHRLLKRVGQDPPSSPRGEAEPSGPHRQMKLISKGQGLEFERSGTLESDHLHLDPESSLCVSPGK